jgi:hypothetical protein
LEDEVHFKPSIVQVFPYFYVPYDEDLPQDIKEALAYVRCLASAVEKAMKVRVICAMT